MRKRIIGTVAAVVVAVGAFAGLAIAQTAQPSPPHTTNVVLGTPGDDVVHGTGQRDAIRTFAGDDRVAGFRRSDRINAGTDEDVIFGNRGNDWIVGQDDGSLDVINCGRGAFDVVTAADPQDQINDNCEYAPEQGGPPEPPVDQDPLG